MLVVPWSMAPTKVWFPEGDIVLRSLEFVWEMRLASIESGGEAFRRNGAGQTEAWRGRWAGDEVSRWESKQEQAQQREGLFSATDKDREPEYGKENKKTE